MRAAGTLPAAVPKKKKPKEPAVPVEALETERQRLEDLLATAVWSFEGLRRKLLISARDLEAELEHLDRSLRRKRRRGIVVEPAHCMACGFAFSATRGRRFHAPSRCPECKSERIEEPCFHVPRAED